MKQQSLKVSKSQSDFSFVNRRFKQTLVPAIVFGKVKQISQSLKPQEHCEKSMLDVIFMDVIIDVINVSIF